VLSRIVIRTGEALLPYKSEILVILDRGLRLKAPKAAKLCGKLLRHTLKALTCTYVRESCTLTSAERATWEADPVGLFRRWGNSPDVMSTEALSVDWHVASEAELAFADDLVNLFYRPAVRNAALTVPFSPLHLPLPHLPASHMWFCQLLRPVALPSCLRFGLTYETTYASGLALGNGACKVRVIRGRWSRGKQALSARRAHQRPRGGAQLHSRRTSHLPRARRRCHRPVRDALLLACNCFLENVFIFLSCVHLLVIVFYRTVSKNGALLTQTSCSLFCTVLRCDVCYVLCAAQVHR
jgi:hypothetical protein